MNSAIVFVLIVVVLAAIGVGIWLATRRRRSAELREHFGAEYDHAVDEYGAAEKAEKVLSERSERVQQLHIRPLSADQSAQYAADWRATQSRFVDDPEAAIAESDRLIIAVMQARGYPMGDFDQRAADVSVDHPQVVDNYRAAHAIAGRTEHGDSTTEDMRQAMVHYRALFDDLIDTRQPATTEAPTRR